MNTTENERIIDSLYSKSKAKQDIYENTLKTFLLLKQETGVIAEWMRRKICKDEKNIHILFTENGEFEAELKFAGDTLVFFMHTNVFNFPNEHQIQKSSYVKADPLRSYCGMIMVYNFLSDSIKYNRMDDLGYMMCRIFINKEGHFFIQGQRQYSFLFKDFANLVMNKKHMKNILLTSIIQAIDFDLLVPPFDKVNQLNVMQKIKATNTLSLKTGKRLGFDLDIYGQDIEMKK